MSLCKDSLKDIEKKTGLVERFMETTEALEKLRGELEVIEDESSGRVKTLSAQAKAEVEALLSRG